MNILNILNKYKYAILFLLFISLNLLGIIYIVLLKNFYKIKLNKLRYNLLYVLEFINVVILFFIFELQIYLVVKANTNWILLIISYLNIIFLIFLIFLNNQMIFKKNCFLK